MSLVIAAAVDRSPQEEGYLHVLPGFLLPLLFHQGLYLFDGIITFSG
jgi:hypothetical protein